MTYGLLAAAAWGISTIAAASAARRIGTYAAVLVSQVLGLAVLVVLAALLRPSLAAVGGTTAVGLSGAGVLGLLGWLCYYRALECGPVGLVSAIGATYGGVTALLAVAVLGERIGGIGGAGVVLSVAGIAMAAARTPADAPAAVPAAGGVPAAAGVVTGAGGIRGSAGIAGSAVLARGIPRPGIPLAFASATTYGVGAFLLGRYSAGAGWLPSTLVAYAASVTALLLALPLLGRPRPLRGQAPGLMWAATAGLTEVGALLAFSRGGQVGQVAVTAAVSSLYPALALVAGILMFRERLSGRQVVGVSCIAAGVVMLGLT
ncbi:MAG TPA: EamA family transporter [Streptosporangiaceae bacterium]|nr:EamA family transporter [Streptosporangiaceae bacterium]